MPTCRPFYAGGLTSHSHGVRVLAGTDVAGTIADEIALLADHGLTAEQAIAAAGSLARDFLCSDRLRAGQA